MICKWCGAKINPSARSCSACGRELPRFSDCGGFYDIVPTAPRNYAEEPQTSQMPRTNGQMHREEQMPEPMPTPRKRAVKEQKKSVLPVVSICFTVLFGLIMLAAVFYLTTRINNLERTIEDKHTAQTVSESEQAEETATDAPAETAAETEGLEFQVVVPEDVRKEDKSSEGFHITKERVDANNISAECKTDNDDKLAWRVSMTQKVEDDVWQLTCDYDVKQFSGVSTQSDIIWEYSIDGNEWKKVENCEGVSIDKLNNGARLCIRDTWAPNGSGGGTVTIMIRCTLTQQSDQGDVIKIMLGNMTLQERPKDIPTDTGETNETNDPSEISQGEEDCDTGNTWKTE